MASSEWDFSFSAFLAEELFEVGTKDENWFFALGNDRQSFINPAVASLGNDIQNPRDFFDGVVHMFIDLLGV